MADFPATDSSGNATEIDIRYYTDLWGVYSFDFTDALPSGDTISAVTLRAFSGKLTRKSTLSDYTEISTDLVDPSYTPQVDADTKVIAKFQYPGTTYANTKATLVFELTLASGGKQVFFFPYVKIYGQES